MKYCSGFFYSWSSRDCIGRGFDGVEKNNQSKVYIVGNGTIKLCGFGLESVLAAGCCWLFFWCFKPLRRETLILRLTNWRVFRGRVKVPASVAVQRVRIIAAAE